MTCCSESTATSPPGSYENPFVIWPGSTWTARVQFFLVGVTTVVIVDGQEEPEDGDPIDLTGRTGTAELRPTTDHVGTAIADLTVALDLPQTGRRRGRVTVTLPAADSAYPQIVARRYVFDVRLDDGMGSVLGSQVFHVVVMEGSTRP